MLNLTSHIGRKFGRLTVVELARVEVRNGNKIKIWKCLCECGKTKEVNTPNLNRKTTQSCGCLGAESQQRNADRMKELADARNKVYENQKFGHLVLGKKLTGVIYEAVCECGTKFQTRIHDVLRGRVVSCGCEKRRQTEANRKRPRDYGHNSLFYYYRKAARRREYEFDLEYIDFIRLVKLPCHYCGLPAEESNIFRKRKYAIRYNGLDRIDNSVGYTTGNVVPCCMRCNIIKGSMHIDTFKDWVQKVYNNFARKDNNVNSCL